MTAIPEILHALAQQVVRGEAGALEVLADALIEHGVIDASSSVAPLALARQWARSYTQPDGIYLAGRIYARTFDVRQCQNSQPVLSISQGYIGHIAERATTTIRIHDGDPQVRAAWERSYRGSAGARVLEVVTKEGVMQFRGQVVELRTHRSSDNDYEEMTFGAYDRGVHVVANGEDAAGLFGEGSELARAVARAGGGRR